MALWNWIVGQNWWDWPVAIIVGTAIAFYCVGAKREANRRAREKRQQRRAG